MYNSIRYVINNTKEGVFILETPAGCGTEMLTSTEELGNFYNRFTNEEKKRVKLCVDTCHIFSAGYDLYNIKNVDDYIENFENLIGWENVVVIHFNNSKRECGCHVDRHDNINIGKIILNGLKHFFNKMIEFKIPIILETPLDVSREDEMKLLKSWLN